MSGGAAGLYPEDGGGTLSLSRDCSLKLLEEPAVYDRASDELYFVDEEAFDFLHQCSQGGAPAAAGDPDLVKFCREHGILIPGAGTARRLPLEQGPIPSLRYLLLHITERCNLRCRHCFLGEAGGRELPVEEICRLADECESMQGLRLIISGGEPLLHERFFEIDACLAEKELRVILLTNGTLLDEAAVERLHADEVQVSLDGMRRAHDALRGEGCFDRAVAALRLLAEAGIDTSVATMIHGDAVDDFPRLAELVRELGVREWNVDLPVMQGRMQENADLAVEPAAAAPLMDLSFGGAVHEPFPGFACGTHLMAVMADGTAARCGFYADEPLGETGEGLEELWQRSPKTPLAALDCDCRFLEDCRGGCRFRAGGYDDPGGRDLCQCYRYGVLEAKTSR